MSQEKSLPLLNAVELRVLGSLIEKSKVTPDYYPMTLNALTAACNQKTSRKPVVEYDEGTVSAAISSLKALSLVSTAVGGSSRSVKYKHNFTTVHPLTNGELAVLCLLFLRGPQTPGELNTNSGRLHEFHSLESVHEVLNQLANAQPPFVKELPRRPGQKELRFTHLLSDDAVSDEEEPVPAENEPSRGELEARLSAVENELRTLKENVAKLMKELLG